MQGASPQTQIPKATQPVVSRKLDKTSSNSVQKLSANFALDKAIIKTAEQQKGVRYVWGGTSRSGFDCSGFVRFVFSKHNIKLPRTSIEQWRVGKNISRSNKAPGDLVFFKTRNARVSHVGIYKGENAFIHASSGGGKIRVDKIEGYYASRYAGARRVIPTNNLNNKEKK
jgi:cell wall-associated NlpC family hydrolase